MSPPPPANPLDERLVEAFFNRPTPVVLGRELLPLSVWHVFVLDAIQSPFVTPDIPCSLTDLYAAVAVCQMRYGEWPQPPPRRSRARRRLDRFLFKLRERKRDFSAEQLKFRDYIQDYFSGPDISRKAKPSGSRGKAPSHISLVTSLLQNMAITEAEAWEMPIGKAYWYVAVFAYQNGSDIRFSNLTEEKMAWLDEQIAKEKERKAARRAAEKANPKLRAKRLLKGVR